MHVLITENALEFITTRLQSTFFPAALLTRYTFPTTNGQLRSKNKTEGNSTLHRKTEVGKVVYYYVLRFEIFSYYDERFFAMLR